MPYPNQASLVFCLICPYRWSAIDLCFMIPTGHGIHCPSHFGFGLVLFFSEVCFSGDASAARQVGKGASEKIGRIATYRGMHPLTILVSVLPCLFSVTTLLIVNTSPILVLVLLYWIWCDHTCYQF